MYIFLIVSTLAWGIAEIFYKKGNLKDEKFSHLKVTIFVGLFMGLYAFVILFTQHINLKTFPLNFVRYLPVASCYILSMIFSYFGVRFIEESISDPIENASCAVVPVLCALILHESFEVWTIVGIALVFIGLICVSCFDSKGKSLRKQNLGKKLAIFAICMPFCYLIFDSVGTFLDIFYLGEESNLLVGVTEQNIEHTANCAYELTFFIVAVILFVFLKLKGEKLFPNVETNNGVLARISNQKWKILAAVFETVGQATYLFALSEGTGIAAVIMGAGTVIISLILSRVFLKEKLTILQYCFIFLILSGIVVISLTGV